MSPAGVTRRAAGQQPRWGIVLLSLVLFATAGGQSGLSLYALFLYKHAIDSTATRIFLGIIGIHTGLLCIMALIGFISLIAKRPGAIDLYSTSLYTLWICLLAFGITNEIMLWRDRDGFRRTCPVVKNFTVDECRKHWDFFFGLTLALWIVSVIVSSTLVSLARDYAKKLVRRRFSTTSANVPPSQTPDEKDVV